MIRSLVYVLLALPALAYAGQDAPARLAFERPPQEITSPSRPVGVPGPRRVAVPKLAASRSTLIDPAGLCESAVVQAEYAQHLPPRLLAAISLTESGRRDPVSGTFRPWPWSINAEGQGQFFATAQDAIAAVKDLQARGVQSIDVGCMQVNLMYHPRAFASLAEAFDPATMDASLLLAPIAGSIGYAGRGDFAFASDGRLTPRGEREVAPFVYAGAAILSPKLFADAPQGKFSLTTVFTRAAAAGRLSGLRLEGLWMHVGTPDAIGAAEAAIRDSTG